ncbi:hypothetical protein DOY81_012905, partial [Sarcophaga bullata]
LKVFQQSVTLHTDVGDIKIELFCEDCPKACENFLALCASDYYKWFVLYYTEYQRLLAYGIGGMVSQWQYNGQNEMQAVFYVQLVPTKFRLKYTLYWRVNR